MGLLPAAHRSLRAELTAEPVAQRVVVLSKAAHRWPDEYFTHLIGHRMPAFVSNGRVMAGLLVAVSEDADSVVLTFSELGPEG